MPAISMFYGIIIYIYYRDDGKRHQPHFHAKYAGKEASIAIKTGDVLGGALPSAKMRLVLAWLDIHREELLADWELVRSGEQPFRIDPLR